MAAVAGLHELLVLFGAAALYGLRPLPDDDETRKAKGAAPAVLLGSLPTAAGGGQAEAAGAAAATGAAGAVVTAAAPSSGAIFVVFAKIGSVLFGSGYVLLAFLRADLVVDRRWLTEGQLLDAVAVGQITPGPVFTTATFVGYLLAGTAGAVAATAGIFLPAFVFVALSGPLLPRLRRSRRAGAFLDGLNVASLALMAVVSVSLARAALVDAWSVASAVASAALLVRTKLNSAWLVLGGALCGNVIHALR